MCSALDGNDSNKYETLQEQFFDWKSVQIYREGVLKLEATLETYKHPGRRHAGYLNDRMRSANEASFAYEFALLRADGSAAVSRGLPGGFFVHF